MNNACPTCGAIYNVAAKDIGRKLKCKKCSSALRVTENGLETEDGDEKEKPVSEPKPASKTSPAMVDDEDDEPVVKKKGKYDRGPRGNPLAAVGGLPTVLFSFGVFLVIVFTSLPIIGVAGTDRAAAYVDKLKNQMKVDMDAKVPKKKPSDLSDSEKTKIIEDQAKIQEDYDKKIKEAILDAEGTKVSNRRDVWMERYGLMFGFIFVSFGCIGYLRTEQPPILKYVAGIILTFMMMVMFITFGGGCGGRPPIGG